MKRPSLAKLKTIPFDRSLPGREAVGGRDLLIPASVVERQETEDKARPDSRGGYSHPIEEGEEEGLRKVRVEVTN